MIGKDIIYREDFVGNFRLLSFATGSYWNTCRTCGKTFIGDKRAASCLDCVIKYIEDEFSGKDIDLS